jgi:excinuclease ABC subunit C
VPEGGSIAEKLERLPRSPGVYLFRDAHGTVIYVGKARSLRPRVRSYFQEKNTPDPKRDALVAKIADLDVVVTDSEIEALLLENTLIKQHAPRYNIRLKDDKSYPYIVVTNEPFPRVFPTRNRRNDGARYFGPYTDVKAMHLMLRTIRGIFPIRSCDFHLDDESIARRRYALCLDYHIRKCEGPCEGLVSREGYGEQIRQVVELLKGRTRAVQAMLEEEMRRHAEAMDFEKAAVLRNRLLALQTYRDRQKVVASDGADRDIIAAASAGPDAVGVVLRVREGSIVGKRHLAFAGADGETPASILAQVVQRYYPSADDVPPELLFPEEPDDAPLLAAWLRSVSGADAAFTVPKIGEKAKLVRMCATNANYLLGELVLRKMKADDTLPKSVAALQADLRLPAPPRRIECFDISHFQGAETVASMVSFLDGKARKGEYRKYRIGDVEGVDDFASMREVVRRRYARQLDERRELPDLVVIDGGKGQLSAAKESLDALGLGGLRAIGLAKRLEEVFVPGESAPYSIARTSPGLRLLQRVRDEAHRFGITAHRALRGKAGIASELSEIPGIGEKRRIALLRAFRSLPAVLAASLEELKAVEGMNIRAAQAVYDYARAKEQKADGAQAT